MWYAKDCAGFTALHLACELGHDKIVARLLAKSPELAYWKANHTGLTCLHLAVIRGHVQLLLATPGCSRLLSVEDFEKKPPLHFAVEHGHGEITAMLRDEAAKQSHSVNNSFHKHHIHDDNDNDMMPALIHVLMGNEYHHQSDPHQQLAEQCSHDTIAARL